jgi:hypothetical protein
MPLESIAYRVQKKEHVANSPPIPSRYLADT